MASTTSAASANLPASLRRRLGGTGVPQAGARGQKDAVREADVEVDAKRFKPRERSLNCVAERHASGLRLAPEVSRCRGRNVSESGAGRIPTRLQGRNQRRVFALSSRTRFGIRQFLAFSSLSALSSGSSVLGVAADSSSSSIGWPTITLGSHRFILNLLAVRALELGHGQQQRRAVRQFDRLLHRALAEGALAHHVAAL